MASVIRPVPEALNLIELFKRDPERAAAWLEGKREFSAPTVRKALGKGEDPVYSHLAELSHPRVLGPEATAYMTEEEEVVIIAGGMPLNDPRVLSSAVIPGDFLVRVALAASEVHVRKEVADTWPTLMGSVNAKTMAGAKAIFECLHPEGIPPDSVGAEVLAQMESVAKAVGEIEPAVADAGR